MYCTNMAERRIKQNGSRPILMSKVDVAQKIRDVLAN